VPDCVVNCDTAAGAGGGARGKYASAQRNVYPGEHCTTERAILCVVVLTQSARKYSVSDVQAVGCKAAADGLEGGSVLSKQGGVRING
jgi:hypothetical protein